MLVVNGVAERHLVRVDSLLEAVFRLYRELTFVVIRRGEGSSQ